jgi:hypothetical protein
MMNGKSDCHTDLLRTEAWLVPIANRTPTRQTWAATSTNAACPPLNGELPSLSVTAAQNFSFTAPPYGYTAAFVNVLGVPSKQAVS